jgi:hypothetical protein
MTFGIFKKLFGSGSWDVASTQPPWGTRPSIYEFVKGHLNPNGHGLRDGGESLPDEARDAEDGGVRWAPGAMDGVLGHHGGEQ